MRLILAANIKKALSVLCRGGFILLFIFVNINVSFGQVSKKESEKLVFFVTHPWIYLISSFIGGAEVEVSTLQIWNSNGDLIRADNGKILKDLDINSKIIALDENDSEKLGLSKQKFENIRFLYSKFPIDINAVSDPSIIPFVAHRVLVILSEWDATNYLYYQRRLAEFQARLSSSVLAGQVLKGIPICAMGSTSGILLQAAGCKIEKPAPEILEQWQKGKFNGLREYLDEKNSREVIIVADDDMPKALKKYLLSRKNVFHWVRPQLEKTDYPSFLHEQYISLWQRIIKKPLPGNKK